jgi:hypothetical protein
MRNRLRCPYLLPLLLLLASPPLPAPEVSAHIASSDIIVSGTMRHLLILPWFDGWRFWGSLEVDSMLKGKPLRQPLIRYYYHCLQCDSMVLLRNHKVLYERSIWFLRKSRGDLWIGNETIPADPGWRPLSDYARTQEWIAKVAEYESQR